MRGSHLFLGAFLILMIETQGLSQPRYTPKPSTVQGVEQSTLPLDGLWTFAADLPADLIKSDHRQWPGALSISIPSQLTAVYPQYAGAKNLTSAAYQRSFELPGSWKGKSIKLRFGSVEGFAEVWINGKKVGEHDGGYIPFELDVSQQVIVPGPNVVTLKVSRSDLSRTSTRDFLGMTQSVYLMALSPVHISKLHVNTTFDQDFINANLALALNVVNEGHRTAKNIELDLRLIDPNGVPVPISPNQYEIKRLSAKDKIRVTLDIPVKSPMHWESEHPHLYELHLALRQPGQEIITVRQKIGFRQVEVRGKELYVNNTPIKLHGTNYHTRFPLKGHAMTREENKDDLQAFKEANINYVRPFPPTEALPGLCDEMGLFLSLETPVTFIDVDFFKAHEGLGNDEAYTEALKKLTLEKIEVFRNHPSVIIWTVGNESDFTRKAFSTAGEATRSADRSRPVMAEAHLDKFGIGLPYTDIDNVHYPNLMNRSVPADRPMIYGEWSHIFLNNVKEHHADPGVRDYWLKYMERHMEYAYSTGGVVGGCVFSGNDGIKYRTPDKGKQYLAFGIRDSWRRAKPEYWHTKKAYSPVQIHLEKVRVEPGRSISLEATNRYNFTNLAELKIYWNYGNRKGEVKADIAPMSTGPVIIPLKQDDNTLPSSLNVKFMHASGYIVDEYNILIQRDDTKKPSPVTAGHHAPLEVKLNENGFLQVNGSRFHWKVNTSSGLIHEAVIDGQEVMKGGPYLVATRYYSDKATMCTAWKLDKMNTREYTDSVRVETSGAYAEAQGKYVYTFYPSGNVKVSYDFEWLSDSKRPPRPATGDMRETGIAFSMDTTLHNLQWTKDSYWTIYPDSHIGRPLGSAFLGTPLERDKFSSPAGAWKDDASIFGSRDFRSTKTNVHRVSLNHSNGTRVGLISDGRQHSRSYFDPDEEAITWVISDFYGGGYENFVQNFGVAYEQRLLEKGSRLKDEVTLRLMPPKKDSPGNH